MKSNFEERKQKRIDNAVKQAEKNTKRSQAYYKEAKESASYIPLGQPILVGHHSEKRHRNHLARISRTYEKSYEASQKAEYYQEKAKSIQINTAIFSDDPKALQKLREELTGLEERQAFMKAANACIRRQDKEKFLNLKFATAPLWYQLNTPDRLHGMGYPSYKLTNNNANINRIKQRIKELEALAQRQAKDVAFPGGYLTENHHAGRIQFVFEGKPDEDTRKRLKGEGFRWSPSEGAWQRHLNANGIWAAKQVLRYLTGNDNNNQP